MKSFERFKAFKRFWRKTFEGFADVEYEQRSVQLRAPVFKSPTPKGKIKNLQSLIALRIIILQRDLQLHGFEGNSQDYRI